MRKIVASSTILFSILVMLQSCSKESLARSGITATPASGDSPSTQTISAKVSPGETYSLNFAAPATVNILQQASHFLVSETASEKDNGSINYKYSPEANYTGADEVTLSYKSSGTPGISGCANGVGGGPGNSGYNYVTIKINVAN